MAKTKSEIILEIQELDDFIEEQEKLIKRWEGHPAYSHNIPQRKSLVEEWKREKGELKALLRDGKLSALLK